MKLSDLTCISLWTRLGAVALGLGILDLVTDVLELLILHVGIRLYLDLLRLGKYSWGRHTLEGDLLTLESPDYRLGALLEEEDGFALGLKDNKNAVKDYLPGR